MSKDINRWVGTGNLTRDAELRRVGESPCLEFGMCVNDRRKNAAGEWEDVPNFVDCTMWGRRAEALSGMLSKGSRVIVEGRLHWRQWTAKDGTSRSKLDVVAEEVVLPPKQKTAPKSDAEEDEFWFGS